ncbi:uncharacterized protein LOC131881179 isoform X1 [Tigriopus californicus]|uniref:uncharacterized protein LOC131881179 isoform X1 n=1 Tax=Tigriopus californicus TaxID=6832 RepID=UPI0027D9DF8D|nr:uncharacterized protein LOC131881179 isoform X1 [Tigriopus californicus]XP_059083944.1 uncharacterized protein LOC131881179 isoform X1 [Tigriopus californicus]XP_059083945.1 uncharacterized protein LOC131881179 isoform X1 [Tigriopus californicus]XP_059083946.1 uncharacterized protein LOC131881179 isoform X1 [Tigriopus californicus]
MESMSQSGILLKVIRQSSGVYICYSDGVRKIRPRLVCTSEYESRVEEDIWDEDQDLFPESDSQDLFNSVSAAKKPRLDEEDKDEQLLFKYKTPVIAFADYQGQLFSLHKKSSTHVYVEICQISTWTCANSCLVKIPLSKVPRTEGEYWMHVLPIGHVVPELTDLMSSQDLDLSHILLVKIPFQRLFVVPIAYGGNVETLLQVPEKLDVSSKVDIFVKLYHYRDVEHSLHEDIIDRILRSAQISLESSHNFIAREDIKEVIPFQDGFLMLLRDGKLWEYYKIGNTVRRTLIPVQLVAMIHFSWDGSGVILTQTYDQYLMKLPFNESLDIADTSRTDLKLIQEALDNVEELERLNQIRMTQETVLKQIKVGASLKEHQDLGQMFSTQISIHPLKVFDLDNGFRSSIKFLNESTFDLMGKFWSLHIAFTTKDSSLSCCHTIDLPQELKHGSSFSAQIDVPEEIRRLHHLPIEVRGDLEFNSKFNLKSSILFKTVFKVQLNTVHFLSVVSDSTNDLIFNPYNQNSCEDLIRDWTISKYPSLSLNVLKKQTRLSTIHVEMTSEMLQNFKDMSLFRAILDGSRSVYNLILFHHGLTLSVTDKKWTISGTDGNILEKVYLDLCHFKRTFALQCNEGKVEVPKAMASKAFELHYELGLLDQDDPTDENLAILNQCMEAFKLDIGAKLC